jgi:hypothetical protein
MTWFKAQGKLYRYPFDNKWHFSLQNTCNIIFKWKWSFCDVQYHEVLSFTCREERNIPLRPSHTWVHEGAKSIPDRCTWKQDIPLLKGMQYVQLTICFGINRSWYYLSS